jgi:hypothetical protein
LDDSVNEAAGTAAGSSVPTKLTPKQVDEMEKKCGLKDLRDKFPMTIKKKTHSAYGAFFRDDVPVTGRKKIVFT